jgi:hypothetical protein
VQYLYVFQLPLLPAYPVCHLPRGYVDREGELHRSGVMRLAAAVAEISPPRDARVRADPGYRVLILLSQEFTSRGASMD